MPRLVALRKLALARASAPGRPRHLSAASGLVVAGRHLYMIADDELHLGVFPRDGRAPGTLVRLRDGRLPEGEKDRKRHKPDFESIVMLPAFRGYPSGALLALGSGSRANRRAGALLAIDGRGAVSGAPSVVDLAPLYSAIGAEFDEPNIEGAFVGGGRLSLLQRGNKGDPRNARISFALRPLLAALSQGGPLPRLPLLEISRFDLGSIDGVPLCFTDGAALRAGGFVFCAVAEATDDSYADGACTGSAIGIAGSGGRLRALWRLDPPLKVEGISAQPLGSGLRILAVTDADDASVSATLLQGTLRASSYR